MNLRIPPRRFRQTVPRWSWPASSSCATGPAGMSWSGSDGRTWFRKPAEAGDRRPSEPFPRHGAARRLTARSCDAPAPRSSWSLPSWHRPSSHTVKRILAESSPLPRTHRRFPHYHAIADPSQRRNLWRNSAQCSFCHDHGLLGSCSLSIRSRSQLPGLSNHWAIPPTSRTAANKSEEVMSNASQMEAPIRSDPTKKSSVNPANPTLMVLISHVLFIRLLGSQSVDGVPSVVLCDDIATLDARSSKASCSRNIALVERLHVLHCRCQCR